MARKIACVRSITDIQPIIGADRIEVAYVGGWPVVTGKGEFNVGEKIVYFEPDAMLPLDNPLFRPLADRGKNRENDKGELCVVLRTVKLRKQISQGLIMPLSAFDINADIEEGTDVSEITGVQKYDPPEVAGRPGNMRNWPASDGEIPHTDEDRIQNKIDMLRWFAETPGSEDIAGRFMPSEKLDGTSTTFFLIRTDDIEKHPTGWRYGACSRKNEVLRSVIDEATAEETGLTASNASTRENVYWTNFDKYGIRERLDGLHALHPDASVIAIQGESTGPGINGNRLDRKNIEFHAFNVVIDGKRSNPIDEGLADIAVPQRPEFMLDFHYGMNPQEAMEAAISKVDGLHSLLDDKRLAEGIVYRFDGDLPEGFNPEWNHFKIISNKYLLKIK